MECRKRKRKGSRKSGVKVRGVGSVAEGKWSSGSMSEVKSGGSWKNGSEGKSKCGREKKPKLERNKKQRLNW